MPKLQDLPSWAEASRVCIDLETRDPDLKKLGPGDIRNGEVAGVSFTIDKTKHSYYLPIGHGSGPNLPAEQVWDYLRFQADVFRGELVAANAQYDLGYLIANDVNFKPSFIRDPQIAAPLLDELQHSYSLQAIAERLNVAGKSEDALDTAARAWGIKNVKADLWRLPAAHVAEYAIQDSILPLQLLDMMEPDLENQGLRGIYDLECRVLPVLLAMRQRGVRVSTDRLEQVAAWAYRQEVVALGRIHEITGKEIKRIWVADDLNRAFLAVGIKTERTPKTGRPKVTKEFLEKTDHPVAMLILEARKFNKIRTTFCETIEEHMIDGRIHCSFAQLRKQRDSGSGTVGAAYGRMSSSHPNLQQVPTRGDVGGMVRSIYLPEEGQLWASVDFSSQETRLIAHYAGLAGCSGGQDIVDAYNHDPLLDFHRKMADIAEIERDDAKAIVFGLAFGMGAGKLCHTLGLPTEVKRNPYSGKSYDAAGPEGQEILNKFHTMVPFMKELSSKCEARAKNSGYVTTLLGRRCRFPLDDAGKFDFTYRAMNRVIQGSAADQTKQAMVDMHAAGVPLQLTIHDEVTLSVDSVADAREVADMMENAVSLLVPCVATVKTGPNWGELS